MAILTCPSSRRAALDRDVPPSETLNSFRSPVGLVPRFSVWTSNRFIGCQHPNDHVDQVFTRRTAHTALELALTRCLEVQSPDPSSNCRKGQHQRRPAPHGGYLTSLYFFFFHSSAACCGTMDWLSEQICQSIYKGMALHVYLSMPTNSLTRVTVASLLGLVLTRSPVPSSWSGKCFFFTSLSRGPPCARSSQVVVCRWSSSPDGPLLPRSSPVMDPSPRTNYDMQ